MVKRWKVTDKWPHAWCADDGDFVALYDYAALRSTVDEICNGLGVNEEDLVAEVRRLHGRSHTLSALRELCDEIVSSIKDVKSLSIGERSRLGVAIAKYEQFIKEQENE